MKNDDFNHDHDQEPADFEDDYSIRQKQHDRAYLEAWSSEETKAWIDSLSLEDRRRLEAEGLLAPLLAKIRSSGGATLDRDLAESSLASETPDIATLIDPEDAEEEARESRKDSFREALENVFVDAEGSDTPGANKAKKKGSAAKASEAEERMWDLMRRMLGEMLSAPNRSLTMECVALVSGLSYTGDSMVSIAKRHGVTRAAVSKRCVELTERLGIPPSRAMRSLTARKKYSHAQRKLHNDKPQ